MWYMLPDSNKQYPLSIERVKEIKRLNARGEKAEELQPVDLTAGKAMEAEHGYVELVGQVSLKSLEKTSRRVREKEYRAPERRNTDRPEQKNSGRQPDRRNNDRQPDRRNNERQPDRRSNEKPPEQKPNTGRPPGKPRFEAKKPPQPPPSKE